MQVPANVGYQALILEETLTAMGRLLPSPSASWG
jgi:hypothetical protein